LGRIVPALFARANKNVKNVKKVFDTVFGVEFTRKHAGESSRETSSMEQGTQLGKLIGDGERRRDAIHIAVAPVTAAQQLRPGQSLLFHLRLSASICG
jgi:hypothetical protein